MTRTALGLIYPHEWCLTRDETSPDPDDHSLCTVRCHSRPRHRHGSRCQGTGHRGNGPRRYAEGAGRRSRSHCCDHPWRNSCLFCRSPRRMVLWRRRSLPRPGAHGVRTHQRDRILQSRSRTVRECARGADCHAASPRLAGRHRAPSVHVRNNRCTQGRGTLFQGHSRAPRPQPV